MSNLTHHKISSFQQCGISRRFRCCTFEKHPPLYSVRGEWEIMKDTARPGVGGRYAKRDLGGASGPCHERLSRLSLSNHSSLFNIKRSGEEWRMCWAQTSNVCLKPISIQKREKHTKHEKIMAKLWLFIFGLVEKEKKKKTLSPIGTHNPDESSANACQREQEIRLRHSFCVHNYVTWRRG